MPYTTTRWTSTHTPTGPSSRPARRPHPAIASPRCTVHPSPQPAWRPSAAQTAKTDDGANTTPLRSSDQRTPPLRHVNAQNSPRSHLQPPHHAEPPICPLLMHRHHEPNAIAGRWRLGGKSKDHVAAAAMPLREPRLTPDEILAIEVGNRQFDCVLPITVTMPTSVARQREEVALDV
jgi:hypothetical protein